MGGAWGGLGGVLGGHGGSLGRLGWRSGAATYSDPTRRVGGGAATRQRRIEKYDFGCPRAALQLSKTYNQKSPVDALTRLRPEAWRIFIFIMIRFVQ